MTMNELWAEELNVDGLSTAKQKPASKPRRQKLFAMITAAEADRLMLAKGMGTVKVFIHLKLLLFKSHGKPVQLTSARLSKWGIGRKAKSTALAELGRLDLIRVIRHPGRSPEVVLASRHKKQPRP